MIRVGEIFLIRADESNGITPKEGYSFRQRYCSKLKPAIAEKLLSGKKMGNLKPEHLEEAKRLICLSPRENIVELRIFGLK